MGFLDGRSCIVSQLSLSTALEFEIRVLLTFSAELKFELLILLLNFIDQYFAVMY